MCDMIATSYMRIAWPRKCAVTPTEDPSSEIVCLVDDDPLVLRSTGVFTRLRWIHRAPVDKGEDSLLMSRHTTSRWWCWTFGWKK